MNFLIFLQNNFYWIYSMEVHGLVYSHPYLKVLIHAQSKSYEKSNPQHPSKTRDLQNAMHCSIQVYTAQSRCRLMLFRVLTIIVLEPITHNYVAYVEIHCDGEDLKPNKGMKHMDDQYNTQGVMPTMKGNPPTIRILFCFQKQMMVQDDLIRLKKTMV